MEIGLKFGFRAKKPWKGGCDVAISMTVIRILVLNNVKEPSGLSVNGKP
jgi:hypothetical protein